MRESRGKGSRLDSRAMKHRERNLTEPIDFEKERGMDKDTENGSENYIDKHMVMTSKSSPPIKTHHKRIRSIEISDDDLMGSPKRHSRVIDYMEGNEDATSPIKSPIKTRRRPIDPEKQPLKGSVNLFEKLNNVYGKKEDNKPERRRMNLSSPKSSERSAWDMLLSVTGSPRVYHNDKKSEPESDNADNGNADNGNDDNENESNDNDNEINDKGPSDDPINESNQNDRRVKYDNDSDTISSPGNHSKRADIAKQSIVYGDHRSYLLEDWCPANSDILSPCIEDQQFRWL